MPVNPYQQYQRQSVMTMTQGEMLTKLYDEVIKQMSGAKICLTEKDLSGVNNALQKVQRILFYLKSTLDFKYEISGSLDALYDFFIERIVQANMKKDVAILDEIIPMIEELRDTFVQADRNMRSK
ncbi:MULTISPECIES: flagellar export chaperone FliS [Anaerotruncus]|jgi:flagellar protein FliS|uniref:Flagellar export chaperone FliS n=1 Tax=Anaerotruncus colihominis TaxID=169435 RepID=A0A845RF38_9FIRM|nr:MULTISPECIES: flagellar export chaperone FliS [Anaerotruncus]MCI8492915.1 flagellar export chaperone FliS [Anaerotruncus sp.]MCR2024307.1 flagellar export chaperone FliS [Anaerotruncus colihominis]NBI77445.1 flagellar export chaperone FliS [Anaerotruncus colihominis]NDO39146.1 flagellar export chaperone FliS [Anaerotruncus colihominis]